MNQLILFLIGIPWLIKVFFFVLSLYFYLMVCMQVYSRFETIMNKFRKNKYASKTEKYLELIKRTLKLIEAGEELEETEVKDMIRTLDDRKDSYLLDLWIFNGVLQIREVMSSAWDAAEKQERKSRLVTFFSKQELYRDAYLKKRRYGNLNALIMIGELRDKRAISILQEYEARFKEELNFYFGYNIALAYAKIGDFRKFIKSYTALIMPNEINDDSLFVYILNNFEGDKEEIIQYQKRALSGPKLNQRILAVKYFDSNKYGEVAEIVLEKMKNAIDTYIDDKSNIRVLDMAMAAIRYFDSVPYPKADEYILQLVDCPIWEVRIVSLNYLIKMDKELVEEIYLRKIKDPNWQIRHNAAKAIVKIGVSKEKVATILQGDDRYAREALEYAIEKRVGKYELG